MNHVLTIYPETPIWNFLEKNKIPWTKSLHELEKSFGLSKEGHFNNIVLGSFPNIFNDEQILIHVEIFNRSRMDFPPTRWVLHVETNDCEKSFTNICSQLTNILGSFSPSSYLNTKGLTWSFGGAELQVTYWFEAQDVQGNPTKPSICIYIQPDFKLFATDAEEVALENAQLIEAGSQQNIRHLPNLNISSRTKPEYSKRLNSNFGTSKLLIGFDKDHQFFYGIQGFIVNILPIDHLESIILQTTIERTKINYLILGCYKNSEDPIFGPEFFCFAELDEFSEALKFAHGLSRATGLKVIEQRKNNQY